MLLKMADKKLKPIRMKIRLIVDGNTYDTDIISGIDKDEKPETLNQLAIDHYLTTIRHFQDDLGKECKIEYTTEEVK